MRKIFITDIHGQYDRFIEMLTEVNYNEKEDLLILGGDYFDRGPKNMEMARWLENNYEKENVILLYGNHDEPLVHLLDKSWEDSIDKYIGVQNMIVNNGMNVTVRHLCGDELTPTSTYLDVANMINERHPKLLDALMSTRFYYETDTEIFTHAGLPKDYKNADDKQWERSIWTRSVDWANSKSRDKYDKPVYIGHWSLSNFFEDWEDKSTYLEVNGIRFCDGGLGWHGPGIAVVID